MFASRRGVLSGIGALAVAGASKASAAPASAEAKPPFQIVNCRELEARAKLIMPPEDFDYIAGGTGDEWTLHENEAAFARLPVKPVYLSGVATPDMTITLFGTRLSCPIFVPGIGGHGRANPIAEVGTAQGAAAAGVLMTTPTLGTRSIEEVAAASTGPKWFQLYLPDDRGLAGELLARARATGHQAIALTIENGGSVLERSLRYGQVRRTQNLGNFTQPLRMKRVLDWSDIEFVQKASGLPVVLKGVLAESVVRQAVRSGIAGIQISNHGGRILDGSPATIAVLPRLAEAAEGKLVIALDGGVRRGQDVFRALALGAHAVGVGRPTLFALALGGAPAVQAEFNLLKTELSETMRLCGAGSVAKINRGMLVEA